MMLFYSKSTGGFYDDSINKAIPEDAVKIDRVRHAILMQGLQSGLSIDCDESGLPILVARKHDLAGIASAVRKKRNKLLSESDWTQLPDSPLSESDRYDWREYRKALRDLPAQSGFPASVSWPELPQ